MDFNDFDRMTADKTPVRRPSAWALYRQQLREQRPAYNGPAYTNKREWRNRQVWQPTDTVMSYNNRQHASPPPSKKPADSLFLAALFDFTFL